MSGRSALVAVVALAIALPCLGAQAPAAAQIDKELAEATQRLASTKVTIEVEKHDPDKVLDIIRDEAKVNIVVDPTIRRRWDTETVTLKLKDVTALSAFYHLLHNLDLVASYANEAFIVNPPDKYQPSPTIAVYDIRDLTELHRTWRLPYMVQGAEIDPLFYRGNLGAISSGTRSLDPYYEFELLNRYPPDPIGEALADAIGRAIATRHPGVTVTYYEGYLVVTEQPKAARLPITPEERAKATAATTGK